MTYTSLPVMLFTDARTTSASSAKATQVRPIVNLAPFRNRYLTGLVRKPYRAYTVNRRKISPVAQSALSPIESPVRQRKKYGKGSGKTGGKSEGGSLRELPRDIENVADDPTLQNPLMRLERMGTGWFGVILDFEGVLVEDTMELHSEAWLRLAEAEGKPRPLQFALQRAAMMKAEQAISEVLCWGREPTYVRRLANRKEEIYSELLGEHVPQELQGVRILLETLQKHNVPIAVCSTEKKVIWDALEEHDLKQFVDVIVDSDDVSRCRPDPEAYAYAAQQIGRPPFRCVVVGSSNQSIEGAHDCGMQCVAVAGRQPLYELTSADLVVRQLDEISLMNLKQLFRMEESVLPQMELEEEAEDEVEPDFYLL